MTKNKNAHLADGIYLIDKRCKQLGMILIIFIVIALCLSANMGDAKLRIIDVIDVIIGKIFRNESLYSHLSQGYVAIVWNIRLPRILCGLFVGAGLSVAGAVFQSLLMNQLADPYTIGISTGAALGASISIYVSGILAIATIPVLPMAFAGALITLFLVTTIASKSKGLNSSNLIISGIIVSSIMSAGISFIKNAAGEDVGAIVFWLMGSLASRTWIHVIIIGLSVTLGALACFKYSDELNILCTGEENAKGLGVNVKKVRKILLVSASLLTAACVSVSGIIGFIGLVIPHILRMSMTSNNRNLLPLSALLGGLILIVADTISRTMFVNEIPVGVLTTLLGGPFFIYIFIKKSNRVGG